MDLPGRKPVCPNFSVEHAEHNLQGQGTVGSGKPAEFDSHEQTHDKAPDMGKPCHRGGAPDTQIPVGTLEKKPDQHEDNRGNLHDFDHEDKGQDRENLATGEKNEIGSHNSGDGSGRSNQGQRGMWVYQHVGIEGNEDGQEIKQKECTSANPFLECWAEDGQKEQVSQKVYVSTVHEAGDHDPEMNRENAPGSLGKVDVDIEWAHPQALNKDLSLAQCLDEQENVEEDNTRRDRGESPAKSRIPHRDHAFRLPRRGESDTEIRGGSLRPEFDVQLRGE